MNNTPASLPRLKAQHCQRKAGWWQGKTIHALAADQGEQNSFQREMLVDSMLDWNARHNRQN